MNFSTLISIPALAERYRKVKKYFHLRESAYDVTSLCQLRCEGCYYFSSLNSTTRDEKDPDVWTGFMIHEKERGINYVNLAGAEPSLAQKVLRACYHVIPLGTVFTNGLRAIEADIGYRIHISVWGDTAGDSEYRRYANGELGPDCLSKQLKNYKGDPRALFVYTFNERNVSQVDSVVRAIQDAGHRVTFNVFSAPEQYGAALGPRESLPAIREAMLRCMDRYPTTVVYSRYTAEVHTNKVALRQLFGCPYPRVVPADRLRIGLGASFRSYRSDLTHSQKEDCCVPATDCQYCRHYAAGSAIVTHSLDSHVESERLFRGWLDYVDTYLAVWVRGYERSPDLYSDDVVQLMSHQLRRTAID